MGALHRPLLQILFGSLLERWIDPSHVAFALGSGGSLLSDACGLFSCWLFVYMALRGFYATVPPLLRWYHARRYPKAPTSNVTEPLIENMKEVANAAFPLYATVPILTDLFQRRAQVCGMEATEHRRLRSTSKARRFEHPKATECNGQLYC